MKIYTRSGDEGETGFFGGGRAGKEHPRVSAYGDVDELSAFLGTAHALLGAHDDLRERIHGIQKLLFGLGGEIATPDEEAKPKLRDLVADADVRELEESIDAMEEELPPLTGFILPGGSAGGAALHVARTVCRRAERAVVGLSRDRKVRPEVIRFLNRLSDWLFVAARWVNRRDGAPEPGW